MSDETNELLRQILESHRQFVALYQREAERATDFRIAATEMQKTAVRRQLIVAMIMGVGAAMVAFALLMSAKG